MTSSNLPAVHDTAAAVAPPDPRYCGARKRQSEGTCTRPAGWGTDHVGQGRCKLHGGATPRKHGRYSTLQSVRIRQLIAAHSADPNPLDTLPELAAARALFEEFIERYDVQTAALIAWHESWRARNGPLTAAKAEALRAVLDEYQATANRGDDLSETQEEQLTLAREAVDALEAPEMGKPTQVLDLSDAYRIVSEITKIVERIEKARAGNAVSYEQLKRFLFALDRILEARIPDPAVLAKVKADILATPIG